MLLNAFNLSRSYNQRRAFPRAEAELRKLQAKVITTGNCINVWNSMQRSNEQYPSDTSWHTHHRHNSDRISEGGILDLPGGDCQGSWICRIEQLPKTESYDRLIKRNCPSLALPDMFQYSEKRITHRLQKLAHEPHAILLGPLFVYEFHRDSNLPPKKC